MCPIFVKLVLDIFAVCSVVPRINLSHTQQLFMPKKSQYSVLFMLLILFRGVIDEICAKK